jgi:hypothetical protein
MSNKVKLISEEFVSDVEYITEEKENGKKDYKIKGIFMQADIKNKNGRVYPMEILQKEVNRYNKEFINEKRAYGELGHPEGPTINLERASHMITALYPDGKNFIGEAKILSTPMGNIVKTLMDEGAKLGVSSRGMGSLEQKKDGSNYVRNDFYLATAADIVSDPSAPSAFVEGIMEGKEWVWDNGIIKEQDVSEIQDQINRARRDEIAKAQTAAFNNFMQKLTKI